MTIKASDTVQVSAVARSMSPVLPHCPPTGLGWAGVSSPELCQDQPVTCLGLSPASTAVSLGNPKGIGSTDTLTPPAPTGTFYSAAPQGPHSRAEPWSVELWGAPGLSSDTRASGQCPSRAPRSSARPGPGTLPCQLFAPLDVPVGLDDARPLLLQDALPSHRHHRGHRGRGGRLAPAQARRQEELLPSSLQAEMGQLRDEGRDTRTALQGAVTASLRPLSPSHVPKALSPELTCSAGPCPLGREVMVGGCVTTSPNGTVSVSEVEPGSAGDPQNAQPHSSPWAGGHFRPPTPFPPCNRLFSSMSTFFSSFFFRAFSSFLF